MFVKQLLEINEHVVPRQQTARVRKAFPEQKGKRYFRYRARTVDRQPRRGAVRAVPSKLDKLFL